MAGVCAGRSLHIPEILTEGIRLHGESVRVCGKLVDYEQANRVAVIEYEGKKLRVNVESCSPSLSYQLYSLFQFIGELDFQKKEPELIARIARNVDGLDMDLYNQALSLCRKYL